MKRSELCRVFDIHRTTLSEWHQRAQQGSLENRPVSGSPRKIKAEAEAVLVQQLQATPDATLEEHVARWKEEQGQSVSRATMARAILRLGPRGWTRKKSLRAQEQDPEARRLWIEQAKEWDAQQLVFLDECGVNTTLHRCYARAPRGQRAYGVVPRNWKHNTTVVGALSLEGVQAAMTLEGALDGAAFEVFIEHFLCPVLKPGQIVIADNLGAHKSPKVKELIEKKECLWVPLPTYSPDLNPIENLWSQFKSHLRKEAPRTQERLDALIWPSLSRATPQHARNWFQNAGYALDG